MWQNHFAPKIPKRIKMTAPKRSSQIVLLRFQSVSSDLSDNSVYTTILVIFDDIEASHMTLRLFYDRDDSPMASVDKISVLDKFTFKVSHPYGCSKLVSVGQWKDRIQADFNSSLFTCTAFTCQGSSGAHVSCVEYDYLWLSSFVHSGGLKSGFNYSGVGVI
ncbi:hypothetical protein BgiMline_022209 [Biomphalaria glabrata]